MYLLRGLGLDFKGFVTSMNMRLEESSLYELHSLFLTKEQTIIEQSRFDKFFKLI